MILYKESSEGVKFIIEYDKYDDNNVSIEVEYYYDYGGTLTAEIDIPFEKFEEIYLAMKKEMNNENIP